MAGALKVAAFTVHATQEQAARWKRAAEADGHRSAGTWLAEAADCYLKARARAGRPVPLAWLRFGRFDVRLGGELVRVQGRVSPPFGFFCGTEEEGPASYSGRNRFVLVYIPEARVICTLRTAQQCRALASELAPALLRGDPPPPAGGIVERHLREAK